MFGGKIIAPDGTVWLAPDVTPMNLVTRIDINFNTLSAAGNWVPTGVPATLPIMYFSRCLNADVGVGVVPETVDGQWRLSVRAARNNNGTNQNVTFRFYIFSIFVPDNQTTHGIKFFDGSGHLTWTCDMIPLQMFKTTIDSSYQEKDVGFLVATMPQFVKHSTEYYSPGNPPVYLFFDWAFKAYGSKITLWPVQDYQASSDVGTPFEFRDCFYINASIYDIG